MLKLAEIALLAARLLVAIVFLLAGATKLVDPVGTRKALRNFGLPRALVGPGMITLPLVELAVAATLIPVSLVQYGAWGALALLVVFLLAVGVAMALGRKPDCHCFGQLHSSPVGWPTLIRNIVLAACAGWLVWGSRRYPTVDLGAWFASLTGMETRIALLAASVAGFIFLRVVALSRPRTRPALAEPVALADDEDAAEEKPAPIVRRAAPAPETLALPEEPPAPEKPGPLGIGLEIGTTAPEFELPSITGEKRSLESLRVRGRDVLLIFSSPYCEPCAALPPKLIKWIREMEGLPQIILISRGTPEENIAKLKGFDVSRVLLQREAEIAETYDSISTPTAVLVGADGRIRSGLATGAAAIKELLTSSQKVENRKRINRQAPV